MLNFDEFQRLDEKININDYARKYFSGFVRVIEKYIHDNKMTGTEHTESNSDQLSKNRLERWVSMWAQSLIDRQLNAILKAIVADELENQPNRVKKPSKIEVETQIIKNVNYVEGDTYLSRNRRDKNLSSIKIEIRIPYYTLTGAMLAASTPGSRKPKEFAHSVYSTAIHEMVHVVQSLRRDNTVSDHIQGDSFGRGDGISDEYLEYANYLARDREIEAHAVGAVRDIDHSRASLVHLVRNVRDYKTLESYATVSKSFKSYLFIFGPQSNGYKTRKGREIWKRFMKKFIQHAQDAIEDA